ncbi:heterokaryon incompatibility protein-domain-containing protein [Paraphoma chrysanthemicola]|uniref:Heterokaryon incompatibility protein-domain-containing protein n=1 Tax=Paraphoma chrysanthemicola TaxID=798071 RepID=A0A8K0R7S8_9PLEO|nr:heterokaryon incompatibility protein-domain-containing protein [Paraphoma chrysanthemicola]
MLCKTCTEMLQDGHGQVHLPTSLYFLFEHHQTTKALHKSAEEGCSICMRLAKLLSSETFLRDQVISVRAELSEGNDSPQGGAAFFLDFVVEDPERRETFKHTFIMKEMSELLRFDTMTNILLTVVVHSRHLSYSTSTSTSSEEVLNIAKAWMKKCRCADGWNDLGAKWYPKRLLDIEDLRNSNSLGRVRLVESDAFMKQTEMLGSTRVFKQPHHRYVTLSHCWGSAKNEEAPLKLTSRTMQSFMTDGVSLQALPRTFQEALVFASKLDGVRFVWLDSLCIRQPIREKGYDEQEQLSDWVEQSRFMDKVYRKAYLNISATASTDGHGGLFYNRNPEHLREDEISLRFPPRQSQATRCTVSNATEWVDLVDAAPINKRGWVVQERLLAPRVLHFCHNQIAWECAEFESAECYAEDMTTLELDLRGEIPQGGIKELTSDAGKKARDDRLGKVIDPDLGMKNLYIYELWKRVVEKYVTTALSHESDKLVALAGIARHFHRKLFSGDPDNQYVAGLWSQNLESQLLWSVNEKYNAATDTFENPARRIATRAPSFSWAAIDTPLGITYGDVTDYGLADTRQPIQGSHEDAHIPRPSEQLFFTVLGYNITLFDKHNAFGKIETGHLLLKPRYLRRIILVRLPEQRGVPYSWSLRPNPSVEAPSRMREYTNINLDAPESDMDIFQQDADLYVMPAAFGPRTVEEDDRYLYCLLLQLEHTKTVSEKAQYRVFKRIGITQLSAGEAARDEEAWREIETDEVICLM